MFLTLLSNERNQQCIQLKLISYYSPRGRPTHMCKEKSNNSFFLVTESWCYKVDLWTIHCRRRIYTSWLGTRIQPSDRAHCVHSCFALSGSARTNYTATTVKGGSPSFIVHRMSLWYPYFVEQFFCQSVQKKLITGIIKILEVTCLMLHLLWRSRYVGNLFAIFKWKVTRKDSKSWLDYVAVVNCTFPVKTSFVNVCDYDQLHLKKCLIFSWYNAQRIYIMWTLHRLHLTMA